MRKLTTNTFITLDGVTQAPGGPDEDPSGGFTHGGWAVNYFDEGMGQIIAESLKEPFDLMLGRKTYEIFAAHWPYATDDPIAERLNSERKYVASRTLSSVDWEKSQLLGDDVADQVAKLKAQGGPDIQVHGSSDLLQTLIKHNLIDEYRLWTFPVVLGTGRRLFADGTIPRGLELIDVKTSTTGVVITTYQPKGEVEYGDTEFEEPSPAEVERRKRLAEADLAASRSS
jgi:dihydrofolate reductase